MRQNRSSIDARSNPGRHGEPPARKSGSESIPEPDHAPVDPKRTPRRDSRREEPPPEKGRGIPERKGGKL
jgi:hypothetical protein